MSPTHFTPELNKLHQFTQYSLLVLRSGSGVFVVDFANYSFGAGKAIFLSPGQYFQLLSGSYVMDRYEFPTANVHQVAQSRVLFKHLVALGHISIPNPQDFFPKKDKATSDSGSDLVLVNAVQQWKVQNPFNASEPELKLLFDLKEMIDEKFREPLLLEDVAKSLRLQSRSIQNLTKEKLQHTVNRLHNKKRLLEARRKIVFTDWSAKEIAYHLGFKDTAYFNRFFREQTGQTPLLFRKAYEGQISNPFVADLTALMDKHFKEEHSAGFYAAQLHLSPKSFSRKLQQQLQIPFGQLMQQRLLEEARQQLTQQIPVNEIAFALGFKEPAHFTQFFKKHSGISPTRFLQTV